MSKRTRVYTLVALLTFASGCGVLMQRHLDSQFGTAEVRPRVLARRVGPEFYSEVKPILDRRCVVCHACYDAPCQLKLSSIEGIDRGANKKEVYDPERLFALEPSRLFVDEQDTSAWRKRKFFPVLNEREQTPEANRLASTLYRMLLLKERHPLPEEVILPKSFDLKLFRDQQCPSIEEFDAFEKEYPLWGMPYALPGLPEDEQILLKKWVESGGLSSERESLSDGVKLKLLAWERFLNGPLLKEQLMSRYLYEHLFLAHLYFSELPDGEYFKLVRSRTPSGEPIDEIASRRPYDDPNAERFYYRLWRERSSISAKTHMPYALNRRRLARWRELFLEPEFKVTSLPLYTPEVAANPFKAFAAIPVRSRYRFLLDQGEFSIMNFIKGPVCRGQTALNVIEDRFWVVFTDPDLPQAAEEDRFLLEQSDHLRLPAEKTSNALVLTTWLEYSRQQKRYIKAKQTRFEELFPDPRELTLDLIWNGDGENTNAALTVFRHHDAATVVRGFVGKTPKTAWVIGYSLLERIHYLLVSGFDVFGNVGHQLNSRLFMDFLRMEGEYNFLSLLPREARERERDFWYRDAGSHVQDYISWSRNQLHGRLGIEYVTNNPKQELLERIRERLGPAHSTRYSLPEKRGGIYNALRSLEGLRTHGVRYMPSLSFLRVRSGAQNQLFTLIRDSGYSNVSTPFFEKSRRIPEEDELTIVRGVLGAYPNALFDVSKEELAEFVERIEIARSEDDYKTLVDRFGVRRTDTSFWSFSDWLHEEYKKEDPVGAGLFDYNRLENR